jgi:RND family efflux transporter MFP subunit
MNDMSPRSEAEKLQQPTAARRRAWLWAVPVAIVALAGGAWFTLGQRGSGSAAQAALAPPRVTVSAPLQREVDTQVRFLGQFSAVDRIELRAQVGGTLTEIHFRDGQIVHKDDLLFVIDPRPYEIRLAQARAQLATATARLALARTLVTRTAALRRTEAASQEVLDQRTAEQTSAEAAVDDAQARVRDAELDLEYCRVAAPFTGRIGARQVSVGSLVAGSRAGAGPTTLLATLVSLDPIYLDFDMSEAEFLAFSRERQHVSSAQANRIAIALSDEDGFTRQGELDFVDNAVNRSSGTIRARATVPNPDLFLTPGAFARLRLSMTPPAPTLLVPDAAVLLDQSRRIVMTVAGDGTVVPKPVETGDLRGGLRVIRSGLAPGDRVIIDGIVRAMPGGRVTPQDGTITYSAAPDDGNS